MWELNRYKGQVCGATKVSAPTTTVAKDGKGWQDFLDWNAKQPVPLDLSDKPPEPPPVDADVERIKEILAKFETATAAEKWEAVGKFLRKQMG